VYKTSNRKSAEVVLLCELSSSSAPLRETCLARLVSRKGAKNGQKAQRKAELETSLSQKEKIKT
jgi:hypothetical protein